MTYIFFSNLYHHDIISWFVRRLSHIDSSIAAHRQATRLGVETHCNQTYGDVVAAWYLRLQKHKIMLMNLVMDFVTSPFDLCTWERL